MSHVLLIASNDNLKLGIQPWNPESKSTEAGFQENFVNSAILLFVATVMASNSTIILRWKLVISTEYIILSSGIAMALSQSHGFTELHGLDTILFYRKFRKKNLLSMSASRELVVVAVIYLQMCILEKWIFFLGYFFFPAPSWIANSHPDLEPQALAALSGHNKVSALSDSLVP